jgi:XTP/dITP diphosphohydrolase
MKIWCASGNAGKLREFRLAGQLLNVDVEPLPGLKFIIAPEETGATFEENACLKAAYYSRSAPGFLFADDSGLAVDALRGEPGVYSARYAGEHATDEDNNRLVLERLGDNPNRTARFVCVIALAKDGEIVKTFRGEVEGQMLHEARGPGGFGYDPLFFYPSFNGSFGEVDDEKKFSVSHRGNAVRAMLEYLAAQG